MQNKMLTSVMQLLIWCTMFRQDAGKALIGAVSPSLLHIFVVSRSTVLCPDHPRMFLYWQWEDRSATAMANDACTPRQHLHCLRAVGYTAGRRVRTSQTHGFAATACHGKGNLPQICLPICADLALANSRSQL